MLLHFFLFFFFCFLGKTRVDALALKYVPSDPSCPQPLSSPSLSPLPLCYQWYHCKMTHTGPRVRCSRPRPPATPHSPPHPLSGPSAAARPSAPSVSWTPPFPHPALPTLEERPGTAPRPSGSLLHCSTALRGRGALAPPQAGPATPPGAPSPGKVGPITLLTQFKAPPQK